MAKLTLPGLPVNHVPDCHIYTFFNIATFLNIPPLARAGQSVPMLVSPFSEELPPDIQSSPPLLQLETVSSSACACYLGGKTNPTWLQPPSRQL